jgi:hypothetical protein
VPIRMRAVFRLVAYPNRVTGEAKRVEPPAGAGLCARCVHARVVESAKGSTFVLCGLAASDSRFPKYPRLPVLQCVGYSAKPT